MLSVSAGQAKQLSSRQLGDTRTAIRVESGYKGLLRPALEAAGVEFIAENGGGAGARLRKGRE